MRWIIHRSMPVVLVVSLWAVSVSAQPIVLDEDAQAVLEQQLVDVWLSTVVVRHLGEDMADERMVTTLAEIQGRLADIYETFQALRSDTRDVVPWP